MSAASPPLPLAVTWHDAECGGYGADLALWEELAAGLGGPVLDLGSGTGRVALHLAERDHEDVARELDAALGEELKRRAAQREIGAAIEVVGGDARELDLGRRFPLILAPMQLLHMLGGGANRLRALRGIAAHLAPGGRFATAVLAEPLPQSGRSEPLPDVREIEGWVHSSLPLEVVVGTDQITIVRLRQLVSPDGELSEEVDRLTVDRLPPGVLDRELADAGLLITARVGIPETDEHVGSVALVMKAGGRDG